MRIIIDRDYLRERDGTAQETDNRREDGGGREVDRRKDKEEMSSKGWRMNRRTNAVHTACYGSRSSHVTDYGIMNLWTISVSCPRSRPHLRVFFSGVRVFGGGHAERESVTS